MADVSKLKPNGSSGTEYDIKDTVARQMASVESLSDTTPYLYRKSPAIGTRVMENALVGASVVKNQMMRNVNTWSASNATGSVSDNVLTFTATATRGRYYSQKDLPTVVDHVCLLCAQIKTTTATSQVQLYAYGGYATKYCEATTNWQSVYILRKTSSAWGTDLTNNNQLSVQDYRTGSWDAIQVKNPQVIDLTEWFGSSTIPDAAYTKEQSTAGSGIAWLKEQGFDFSKYIAYNTGELCSVNPSAKKVVGFNVWDEEYENGLLSVANGSEISGTGIRSKNYNACIGGEDYYLYKAEMSASKPLYVFWFDENKAYISNSYKESAGVVTSPSNARFFRLRADGETTSVIICINISKPTGTPKNGDYVPYEEHTYPISPSPLRGLFVLDGDTIKASGDVRKSDGSVDVEYAEIEFDGSTDESWGEANYRFYIQIPIKVYTIKEKSNMVCSGYVNANSYQGQSDKECASYAGYFYVKDSACADLAAFKTALASKPIKLAYEKATPTTEQLAPFDNPQISIVGGTEEWLTDNDVPVGHESEYKKLPPLFEDDYIQTIQERAENVIGEIEEKADNTTKTQPNYYHQYDSVTHKFTDTARTFNPYNVENILDIMENTRQALETAINDHASQFSPWLFVAEVGSSGTSVTIPSSAVRILVELYVIDSSGGSETHVICASLDAEANNPVRDEYIELHGTALNADHYVTGKAIGTDTWTTSTNTVARVYYRK